MKSLGFSTGRPNPPGPWPPGLPQAGPLPRALRALSVFTHASSSSESCRGRDFTVYFAGFQQLPVFAYARDASFVEHQDCVGVHDRGHALGDDEHRGLGGVFCQRGAQLGVRFKV